MSISRIIVLIAAWLFSTAGATYSQQVLNVTGTQSEANGLTLQYSVGELMVRQPETGNHLLTEGVIQPVNTLPTALGEPAFRQKIEVFPNPAFGYVHVRIPDQNSVQYLLIAESGQIVRSGKLDDGSGLIQLEDLPAGWYAMYLKSTKVSFDPVKLVIGPDH